MQTYDSGIMITVIMSIKCMYSAFLDEQYFVTVKEQSTRRDTTAVITVSKEVFVKVVL